MKLRIRENALRIRITQTELKFLLDGNEVKSAIQFPNQTILSYGLVPTANEATSVQYQENKVSIYLSYLDVETLGGETNVGVQSIHQTEGEDLNLLVEKDFSCLHPRDQEDADTFPNPNQKEIS